MISRIFLILLSAALLVGVIGCGDKTTQELAENTVDATTDDAFCEAHQIAEAMCPYCDPSLIESLGFCYGHDVPEAFCYKCNPALIPAFKSVGDWCGGHDRPESQCYICNPELDPALQAAEVPEAHTNVDPGPAPTSRAQQPPSVTCSTQSLVVRLDSPEIAAQAGLEFATLEYRPITKTVQCNAQLAYDGTRYAQVVAQVPGIVAEVHRDFGDAVQAGDPLVTITSANLGRAKAALLQAAAGVALWERNFAREKDLLERGVSTEKDLIEAETHLAESRIAHSEAQQALFSFGLSNGAIKKIQNTQDTSARYTVTAPFAGLVVDRQATLGEVINPSKMLFAVADVAQMWAVLDIQDSDLRHIQVGQPAVLQVEGLAGESYGGPITWISSQLNAQTRTLQARAVLDNADGLLRANMFASARVGVRNQVPALAVPVEAVQWEGCCNIVFVKASDTEYQPRKVHLGVSTGQVYEVLSGLKAGDEVVTQGSFLLKTEILKGSIGAGCCEIDPGA